MTAFDLDAPAGVIGDPSRFDLRLIEPGTLDTVNVPTAFGVPVNSVNGKYQAIQAGQTAANFFGVLSRLAPSIGGDTAQAFNTGTPNQELNQGILKQGYILIECLLGVPVKDQPVYMRVVENLPNLVGAFEATSVPGENVILPNASFAVSGVDASNVTEIRVSLKTN